MSTNRFLKMFADLLDCGEADDIAAQALAKGEKAQTTAGTIKTKSKQASSQPPGIDAGAVMNVTMQPSTGTTRVSLSSETDASQASRAGENRVNERYQGFFDVAAAAVRGAVVGQIQPDKLQSIAKARAPGKSASEGSPPEEGGDGDPGTRASGDTIRAELWTPASESRASSRVLTGEKGTVQQLPRSL